MKEDNEIVELLEHPFGNHIEINKVETSVGAILYVGEIKGHSILVQASSLDECVRELFTSALVFIDYLKKELAKK